MYNDYMTSKSRNLPKDIINKKFDNLRKSMAFLEKNGAKEERGKIEAKEKNLNTLDKKIVKIPVLKAIKIQAEYKINLSREDKSASDILLNNIYLWIYIIDDIKIFWDNFFSEFF